MLVVVIAILLNVESPSFIFFDMLTLILSLPFEGPPSNEHWVLLNDRASSSGSFGFFRTCDCWDGCDRGEVLILMNLSLDLLNIP